MAETKIQTRFNVLLILSMLGRRARHELQLLLVVNLQREISQHLPRGGGGGCRSHDGGSRRGLRRRRGGGSVRVSVGGRVYRGWLKLNDGCDHGRDKLGDRSRYGEKLRLMLKRRRLRNHKKSSCSRNDGV
ncbi:hypothetical protein HKD37_03G006341 [Glycine soja]